MFTHTRRIGSESLVKIAQRAEPTHVVTVGAPGVGPYQSGQPPASFELRLSRAALFVLTLVTRPRGAFLSKIKLLEELATRSLHVAVLSEVQRVLFVMAGRMLS